MRVYIAGPYSKGDQVRNVNEAVYVGNVITKRGMFPFVPHLYHFWHYAYPKSYQEWLDQCLVWLACCHVVYRLPGESPGADIEVSRARELGIPVVRSLHELIRFQETAKEGGSIEEWLS